MGSRFDKCIHLNHSLNLRSTHIHRRRKVWFQGSSRPSFPSRSINHRSIGLGIYPRHLTFRINDLKEAGLNLFACRLFSVVFKEIYINYSLLKLL
jgi:hypothetical protein